MLNDGSTTEISGVTAGQLATVLTAYTPLSETASNTASISANATGVANNTAAIAALQSQVDSRLGRCRRSHRRQLLQHHRLEHEPHNGVGRQDQPICAGRPATGGGRQVHPCRRGRVSSAITSASNATLASLATNYVLRTVTDQLALDLAAKQSGPDVDQKIATALLVSATDLTAAVNLKTTLADVDQRVTTALLTYVTQVALDAALALRDGRMDSAEASIAALQAAGLQTAAQVASAITTALLPYTDTTGLNSLLAVRDGRLDGAEASISSLQAAGFQTAAQVASAIASALLPYVQQTGLVWRNHLGLASWHNTLRKLHFNAPLSVSLQNEGFTLSLVCDSYSIAQADSAIAAVLVPYETAAQRRRYCSSIDGLSTTTETNAAIAAALVQFYSRADAVAGIDLSPYYTSAQTDAAITAALVLVTLSNAAWGAKSATWKVLKSPTCCRICTSPALELQPAGHSHALGCICS